MASAIPLVEMCLSLYSMSTHLHTQISPSDADIAARSDFPTNLSMRRQIESEIPNPMQGPERDHSEKRHTSTRSTRIASPRASPFDHDIMLLFRDIVQTGLRRNLRPDLVEFRDLLPAHLSLLGRVRRTRRASF